MKIVRFDFNWKSARGWHWWPRVYDGVNGVTTRLLVWGWWSLEVSGSRGAA